MIKYGDKFEKNGKIGIVAKGNWYNYVLTMDSGFSTFGFPTAYDLERELIQFNWKPVNKKENMKVETKLTVSHTEEILEYPIEARLVYTRRLDNQTSTQLMIIRTALGFAAMNLQTGLLFMQDTKSSIADYLRKDNYQLFKGKITIEQE